MYARRCEGFICERRKAKNVHKSSGCEDDDRGVLGSNVVLAVMHDAMSGETEGTLGQGHETRAVIAAANADEARRRVQGNAERSVSSVRQANPERFRRQTDSGERCREDQRTLGGVSTYPSAFASGTELHSVAFHLPPHVPLNTPFITWNPSSDHSTPSQWRSLPHGAVITTYPGR